MNRRPQVNIWALRNLADDQPPQGATFSHRRLQQALVGESAKGLSANVIVKLKDQWADEHEAWSKRDLTGQQHVYVWADGIHVNVRLEDDANKRQCLLVVMGATPEGKKEQIAVYDGYRESEQSWSELLLDLKQRGLTIAPKLAIGDGALGFRAALRKVYSEGVQEQRCWVHKTAIVLNKLPKSVQPKAKADLKEIDTSPTREDADKADNNFIKKYEAKYAKACGCLAKDRDVMLTFYEFPAQHWGHSERPTRSSRPSPRSASGTVRPKAAAPEGRHWP